MNRNPPEPPCENGSFLVAFDNLVFGEDHKYYLDDKHVSPSYIVPPSVESVDRAHNWFATLPMDGTEKTWIMASEISSHLGINDGGVVLAADRQSRMSMSN